VLLDDLGNNACTFNGGCADSGTIADENLTELDFVISW
jgi:hypothetical protein